MRSVIPLLIIVSLFCLHGYSQNLDQGLIIVKVKAKYTAFPRGNFNSFDPYGVEFKVLETVKGTIDSLTYDSTIGIGYKISKGIGAPKIVKDSVYYLLVNKNNVSYNPIAKIKGNIDTIDDPWFADKELLGTVPSFTVEDIESSIFYASEKSIAVKGSGSKEILVDREIYQYDILSVEFDALRVKDKIMVTIQPGNKVIYNSYSYISGVYRFVIPLADISGDLSIKITNEEENSSWNLKYRLIDLLPINLDKPQED